ncbi:MAG: DUF6798 domain-containing protein [bacterium]
MTKPASRSNERLAGSDHIAPVAMLIVAGGSALLALYATQGALVHPFTNMSDATIYAEVGFRLNDPSLYVNDPVISLRARDFPTIFYALLPNAWESLENAGSTYALLGCALGITFGVGIYLLTWQVFQRRDIALLTAVISMLVGRSLMQTPVGWGTRVITPRYIVFGLSPLLLWLYWRWRRTWKVTLVFGAFGGLLFMHPRFSIYPVTLMGIGLLLQQRLSVRRAARVAGQAAPFLPFLAAVLWIAFSRLGSGVVTAGSDVSFELSPYDFPGGLLRQLFFSSVDAAMPVGLGVLGWLRKRDDQGIRRGEREALVTFSVVPVVIYAVFWLAIQWLPVFERLNIKRFLTWSYVMPYAFGAYWLIKQWNRDSLMRRLIAVVALVALLTLTYGRIHAGLLEDNTAYRRLVDWVYDRLASAKTHEGHEVILAAAAQADDIEQDWESFHALCDWAHVNTDVDAVFVIPPRNFSLFRLYSQRSLYAMAKNVSFGSLYESERDLVWRRYEAATAAYTSGKLDDFRRLRALGRADYVVVERGKFRLSAPVAYENRRYLVYELPSRSSS